ncbi:MAG: SAM-dependent methyltransferase [Chitinophagaceae bacterium BSSC1]|nr:MAG: SAM-dependent methyltransferase [Chitinophagaceae bacterium BSSC1]
MNVQNAYNEWAEQYDTNQNKTRDLEAIILRETLSKISFNSCLEIGCGTGKNTVWLQTKAQQVLAVDFSEEMLSKAKEKISQPNVQFLQADITEPWHFAQQQFDLVSFSLVLEHIEDLTAIFQKVANSLNPNGHVYIAELHPFKQYSGSKARFETATGTQVVTCFTHHVSDFVIAAKQAGLELVSLEEYFDDQDRNQIPRILQLLFRK